ncbi:glycosyltransferase family 1 protein [Corallococcus sp. CA053C]|uniref:spore coat polysaccharide biosynthesis glycosyltransferase ExoP n=1 Tax=Corallococcus sp. CA053C TaxID=2316732 RepID=UPI000EA00CA8|nr:spore coat polysaccharide biosynthesis glycosyltransferase ExoP [Corallococcus sp. CA053C]RKG96948.1 glycosyltransferase family 1 protein [Corallococcus sp. CA053C]
MRRSEEVDLSKRALRGRDLVVFSNDWDGDPLSKVHIMRILSRDNRVLWVNSIGNRAPKANAHDAQRIIKKLKTFSEGIREVEPNLHVLAPLAIPFYGSELARQANRHLLRLQVLRAMKQLKFERPISWSFLPASAPVSGTLGEDFVVYHCVDEFSAFSDTNGKHIAQLEERLLRRADMCITSAERLYENKKKQNKRTVLVRHGTDFTHFVKACDAQTKVPEDIAKLPKPIIGFFGLVADWIDQDAIVAVAKAHPEGSVVIVGKTTPDCDDSKLRAQPNIHMLGRKPYADLPGYNKAFDVALNPFVINELTLNSNPLKVREYLASGLPVVSSDLPEVRKVGLCRIATTPEDYVKQVNAALADHPGPNRERAEKIFHESWEARVTEIRQHVGEAMLAAGKKL